MGAEKAGRPATPTRHRPGEVLLALPFVILTILVKLFLSERLPVAGHEPPGASAAVQRV